MSGPLPRPGGIVLIGSGEIAAVGHEAVRWLRSSGRDPRRVAVIETPAGFEPNSEEVAARWARSLRGQPELHGAEVALVPARGRGTPYSPDDPEIARPILGADLIALGAGSPTYAARQLRASVTWANARAAHLCGATLFLASAAAIAAGTYTLPVYEIYRVGADLHWTDGLRLFELYGLALAPVTHWDNAGRGAELDTSRCFMGAARFGDLLRLLPAGVTVVGVDEDTALAMDPATGEAHVLGHGGVTLMRDGREMTHESGARLALSDLGSFSMPDASRVVDEATGAAIAAARASVVQTSAEVDALVERRAQARARRDWPAADRLRDEIAACGWAVEDTPGGPRVLPRRGA